jgi:hypothetical protein
LTANAVGALLWSAVFGYGAFLIGKGAENTGHSVEIGLGLLALIFLVVLGFYLRRNEHRLQEAAEAALPGPLPASSRLKWLEENRKSKKRKSNVVLRLPSMS